jgi:hypothetical protein
MRFLKTEERHATMPEDRIKPKSNDQLALMTDTSLL